MAEIVNEKDQLHLTWKEKSEVKTVALSRLYSDLVKLPVYTSKAANTFQNVYTDISIRDEYGSDDYSNYRPGERVPKSPKGKIAACMQAYEESGNGIIKNTVDLMADFTIKGIDVAHTNKKVEMWWKTWFHNVVNGPERSERIVNLLPRAGFAVIQENTVKLPLKKSREYFKGQYAPNTEYVETDYAIDRREIPVSYNILNPLSLDVENEKFVSLLTPKDYQFSVKLPDELVRLINYPGKQSDQELIKQIPAEIINRVREGHKNILLDKSKVTAVFYKKDDWKVYPTPMLYTVLEDLITLKKMKLADRSALDGVISQLRIWKIGNLEHGIFPEYAAMQKLSQILMNAAGGGVTDLIWGPDLELQEITANYQAFLGEAKYIPTLNAICTALGIPALFTGSTSQGSFTTNYIAIQTLIERLESFRTLLINFWEEQFKKICISMRGIPGFEKPPILIFDRMILSDPSSIYQILTNMVDRNILSEEFVQNVIGAVPEIENARLNRENKQRDKEQRPQKASPYHRPQIKDDWLTNFINQGVITPSEVGVELEERKKGEKTPQQIKDAAALKLKEKEQVNPVSAGGRPKNKKDGVKRKTKVPGIRTKADFGFVLSKVQEAQEVLSNKLSSMYLKSLNKKDLRQLTCDEFKYFEDFKFAVLCNAKIDEELNDDKILEIITAKPQIPTINYNLLKSMIEQYESTEGIQANITTIRRLQAVVCASLSDELEVENETDNTNNSI